MSREVCADIGDAGRSPKALFQYVNSVTPGMLADSRLPIEEATPRSVRLCRWSLSQTDHRTKALIESPFRLTGSSVVCANGGRR